MKRIGLITGLLGISLSLVWIGWSLVLGTKVLPAGRTAVGLMALALLLVSVFMSRREVGGALRGRRLQIGLSSVVYVLVVAVILLLVNFTASRNRQRWDLTDMKRWSLSPVTERVLGQLESPVELVGFFTSEQKVETRSAREIYRLYSEASPLVSYRFVDPLKNPAEAERFGIRAAGVTAAVCEDRFRVDAGAGQTTLTNLIAAVAGGERRALFIMGHGSRSPNERGPEGYSKMRELLEESLYEIDSTLLRPGNRLDPAEYGLVIVAGPQEPLEDFETGILDAYLLEGGHLLTLIDPFAPGESSPLQDLLGLWGLEARPGVVAQENEAATPWLVFGTSFGGSEELTEFLQSLEGRRVVFDRPGPLGVAEVEDPRRFRGSLVSLDPGRERIFVVPRTTPGRPDPGGETLPLPAGEPVPLAMYGYREVVRDGKTRGISRLAVLADADFGDNYTLSQYDNRVFLTGLVSWLTEERLVVSEAAGGTRVRVEWRERWRPIATFVFLPPVLIALLGTAILLYRRWR